MYISDFAVKILGMKVSVEEREGLFRALKVEIEGEPVKKALDDVYNYLKEHAQVEGFRKGKAPLWLIRAKYKEYIQEEVGKAVANTTLAQALQESQLTPVADIFLESVNLEEVVPRLIYTVSFEVPPEFELKGVEGLEVEVPKVEFSEELVKERIDEIREEHALWEPVEREIREGDLVLLEYEVEDKESGEKDSGETSAVVGQNTLRQEIEKELLGKREGDKVELDDITLYDIEGNPAGKARIRLRVKSVKEKVLPELNDDFAKEAGLGETWQSAEERIRQEVKESLEGIRKNLITEAVAKKLIELHEFPVPQTLLLKEVSHLVESRVSQLTYMGIDTKYLDYKSMAKELMPQAVQNVKFRFILDKYAKEKGIEPSEEDINKKVEELAKAYQRTPEDMRRILHEEDLLGVLIEDIKREKALEDIISKVAVKEKEEKKDENT